MTGLDTGSTQAVVVLLERSEAAAATMSNREEIFRFIIILGKGRKDFM
jgi:hypothetical protein